MTKISINLNNYITNKFIFWSEQDQILDYQSLLSIVIENWRVKKGGEKYDKLKII